MANCCQKVRGNKTNQTKTTTKQNNNTKQQHRTEKREGEFYVKGIIS